jgi:hypothetical protein
MTDWKNEGRKSIWYNSRFYRTNLFWENDQFRIRDIHHFDERYAERYIKDVCTGAHSIYDTLPVFDGYLWSRPDEQARMELVEIRPDGTTRPVKSTKKEADVRIREQGEDLVIEWTCDLGLVKIHCRPNAMELSLESSRTWGIAMSWSKEVSSPITKVTPGSIHYHFNGFNYQVRSEAGQISHNSDGKILIASTANTVRLGFSS